MIQYTAGVTALMREEACGGITSLHPSVASFDALSARAETDGNKVTFAMTTRGTAGADKPKKSGKFAGSQVYAYVWPTKVYPEAVGFEKAADILAAAVTAHPDFNDEPLFENNGANWHFHWVIVSKDPTCGPAALNIKISRPAVSRNCRRPGLVRRS